MVVVSTGSYRVSSPVVASYTHSMQEHAVAHALLEGAYCSLVCTRATLRSMAYVLPQDLTSSEVASAHDRTTVRAFSEAFASVRVGVACVRCHSGGHLTESGTGTGTGTTRTALTLPPLSDRYVLWIQSHDQIYEIGSISMVSSSIHDRVRSMLKCPT